MGNSMMDKFMPFIQEMMENPPDPNESLPLANHFKTACGATIPFLVRLSMLLRLSGEMLIKTGAQLGGCGPSASHSTAYCA